MQLVQMCLEAASESEESVRSWRRQRRTLERMPVHLAELLLHQLVANRLLSPPLLELFQFSVQELDLKGELAVDAEWMAYIGGFRHLQVLKLADCKFLTSGAISALAGTNSLEELELDRCRKITDEAVGHIATLENLRRLGLSECGISHREISRLSALTKLTHLNLGGLPVRDKDVAALQSLRNLIRIDLWGSKVTNEGAQMLAVFPQLKEVSLAWTFVTVISYLPALSRLDLRSCTVMSICESLDAGLTELHLSGADVQDTVLTSPWLKDLSVLSLSSTTVSHFDFLSGIEKITKLELSSTKVTDDSMPLLSQCGGRLKWLDLSRTRVTSAGVAALTGCVPVLEFISLKRTCIDDEVFACLGLMTSLCSIDLSRNNIKGRTAVVYLQQLPNLNYLDLRQTAFSDESCKDLAQLVQLSDLLLQAEFLTENSLHALSALPRLTSLAFQGSVLTDSGLNSFKPPPSLKSLDLTDCWLLFQSGISKFLETNPHIKLVHERHAVDVSKQQNPRARKSSPSSGSKEPVRDERLRYTKPDLLGLAATKVQEVISGLPSFLRKDPL